VDLRSSPQPHLNVCPFCGGGETRLEEKHLSPRMDGPGALISVAVRHWCTPFPGAVQQFRECRGRDMDSAVGAYNRTTATEQQSTSPQTRLAPPE
jgi:hypothetical protein